LIGVLTRSLDLYSRLFVLAIAALIGICVSLRHRVGREPELGFLAVALVCGSLLSVSAPKMYVSWDEEFHYKKAQDIALLVARNTFVRPGKIPFSYSIEKQRTYDALVESSYRPPTTKPTIGLLTYNNIGYLPSALMIAIGNSVRLPYHIVYLLGRWINIVLFSFVVFSAIRRLKTGKMILSIIALFPTSIFLAAVYNYDSWVTACTMLGFAYLFSELQQPAKKVSVREQCAMVGAFVIGLGPKTIYFPLMFLLLFMKPEKFNSLKLYKRYVFATISSILLVCCSFMLSVFASAFGKGDPRGGEAINSAEQVRFIVAEPFVYAKILFHFIREYINPLNTEGLVTFFAYLGLLKGFWLVLIVLTIVVFTDKNKFDERSANWRIRLGVAGAFIATVALISTALYVSFTPVRSPVIVGVQPRYLLPLVFPLLLILGSWRIKFRFNRNVYNSAIFYSNGFRSIAWHLGISHKSLY